MRWYVLFFVILISNHISHAQLFNFVNIFRPNIRFSGTYEPGTMDSLGSYRNYDYGAQVTIPLPTRVKFKLSLKNFDIGARQSFIGMGYKFKNEQIHLPNHPSLQKTAYATDFSYLRIKIGMKDGVQLMGLSASLNNELGAKSKPNLSFWFLQMKLKSLSFQYGYGAAVAWSQYIPIAVPIFMTRVKLAKKLYWYNILPVRTFVTWAPAKALNIDFYTGLSGQGEGWKADTVLEKWSTKNWYFSRFQIRSGVLFQCKLGKNFNWAVEAGYAWLNRTIVQFQRKPVYYAAFWPGQYYVKTGLVFHFGSSLFQSKVLSDL